MHTPPWGRLLGSMCHGDSPRLTRLRVPLPIVKTTEGQQWRVTTNDGTDHNHAEEMLGLHHTRIYRTKDKITTPTLSRAGQTTRRPPRPFHRPETRQVTTGLWG